MNNTQKRAATILIVINIALALNLGMWLTDWFFINGIMNDNLKVVNTLLIPPVAVANAAIIMWNELKIGTSKLSYDELTVELYERVSLYYFVRHNALLAGVLIVIISLGRGIELGIELYA